LKIRSRKNGDDKKAAQKGGFLNGAGVQSLSRASC
jgi:hypothetical protein